METEIPDIRTHKLCRSCGEWLKPEYGSMKAAARRSPFSLGSMIRDIAGDTSHHYFLCYDCEHKRNLRRIYLFGGLALLVGLAYLAQYFLGT